MKKIIKRIQKFNFKLLLKNLYFIIIPVISIISLSMFSANYIGYPRFGMINGLIGLTAGLYLKYMSNSKVDADDRISNLFLLAGFCISIFGLASYTDEQVGQVVRILLFSMFLIFQLMAFFYYVTFIIEEDLHIINVIRDNMK